MEDLTRFFVTQTIQWLPQIGFAAFVFLAFWLVAKGVGKAIKRTGENARLDPHIASLIAQTANVVIVILGIVTALGTLGINVTALVAGLGLTGFALGFALKDTISNLLAGILILIYHPFNIHDKIRVSGYEGKVISIDLRYTKLENEDRVILIPNSKLFTDPITILKD